MNVREVALSVKRFVFEKFYGAFVWIAFCAILDGLWCWADAYLPDESWGMNLVRNVFWFSAVAVVAGASGYSLWTKRVGRAVGQLLLSLVTFGVASVLLAVVNVFTFEVALEHRGPDKGWWSVGPNEQVPFAVEYRSLHPFLAEYERRITFRSGRHVNLDADTGGAGAFAVFELAPTLFYLVDGLEHDFVRREYRIDVKNETAAGKMSQVGVALSHRRYLGKICPSGKFEQGGIAPDVADN